MNHMEYSIALPSYVELTNAGGEWTKMKQRLYIHLNPNSTPYQSPCNLSTAFLVSISLEQVQEVFNRYGLSIEETSKFNKILRSIEDICLPRFLIIYNRYRFFTCKQNGPEFNGFLQQLLAWSDLCEFGDLKDILLKDCIISGISEESVRQTLLRTEKLDFDKTVEICKAGLVKKHGNETVKPNEHKDAWTITDDHLILNSGRVCNMQMLDAATDTDFLTTIENKESQTEETDFLYANTGYETATLQENQAGYSMVFDNSAVGGSIDNQMLINDSGRNDSSHNYLLQNSEISRHDRMQEIVLEKSNELLEIQSNSDCLESLGTKNSVDGDTHNSESMFNCTMQDNDINIFNPRDDQKLTDEKCLEYREIHLEKSEQNDFKFVKSDTLIDGASLPNNEMNDKKRNEKSFKCKSCSSSFNSAAHLRVHIRIHTGERPFVCDCCGKGYAEASKLKVHLRNHTNERPYKCSDCAMTFKWSSAFKRHQRTHTGEKPYKCDKCSATFADITSRERHIKTHTKDRPYMCMCGSSFTDPSALRVHKRIHTGERPYSCFICSASFVRAQHLKDHGKLHSGEKPHECEICHARFAEASKLKSHKRKHTGEKPYLCKTCGQTFSWTAAYNRHLRTHTLDKPYVCRFCGYAFADNSTLVRHRRTHTGERPYQCTQCSSSFADSSSLRRHLKIHSGVKPFTCNICGASFTLRSYLNRHLPTHSQEKKYECDLCNSKFIDSSKLKRHKKIHSKAQLKGEKSKPVATCHQVIPEINQLPSSSAEIGQLQYQDLGQYLSRPTPFDPPIVREDHDFETMPVANSVLDAFLDIQS